MVVEHSNENGAEIRESEVAYRNVMLHPTNALRGRTASQRAFFWHKWQVYWTTLLNKTVQDSPD